VAGESRGGGGSSGVGRCTGSGEKSEGPLDVTVLDAEGNHASDAELEVSDHPPTEAAPKEFG
jgi:hypothetical protein